MTSVIICPSNVCVPGLNGTTFCIKALLSGSKINSVEDEHVLVTGKKFGEALAQFMNVNVEVQSAFWCPFGTIQKTFIYITLVFPELAWKWDVANQVVWFISQFEEAMFTDVSLVDSAPDTNVYYLKNKYKFEITHGVVRTKKWLKYNTTYKTCASLFGGSNGNGVDIKVPELQVETVELPV